MTKFEKLLEEKNITTQRLSRLMGRYVTRNAIDSALRNSSSLSNLDLTFLADIARALNVDLYDLFEENDINGVGSFLKSISAYLERIRRNRQPEEGDFEVFYSIGKRLKFETPDSDNLSGEKSNVQGKRKNLEYTQLLQENLNLEKSFRDSLDENANNMRIPVYFKYTEKDNVKSILIALFRGKEKLYEQVEILKAVWCDEAGNEWYKTYGTTIYEDFKNFEKYAEQNEISSSAFYEIASGVIDPLIEKRGRYKRKKN